MWSIDRTYMLDDIKDRSFFIYPHDPRISSVSEQIQSLNQKYNDIPMFLILYSSRTSSYYIAWNCPSLIKNGNIIKSFEKYISGGYLEFAKVMNSVVKFNELKYNLKDIGKNDKLVFYTKAQPNYMKLNLDVPKRYEKIIKDVEYIYFDEKYKPQVVKHLCNPPRYGKLIFTDNTELIISSDFRTNHDLFYRFLYLEDFVYLIYICPGGID